MLSIKTSKVELYDESTNKFLEINPQIIELEHSLVSISKWESKWEKPFLNTEKTNDEVIDYIKCMTVTEGISDLIYDNLSSENQNKINDYINKKMSATIINELSPSNNKKEVITSEIIYYWLISLGIPTTFESWHLNRLMTLIKVFNVKNQPIKKLSNKQILENNRLENERRKKQLNTRG